MGGWRCVDGHLRRGHRHRRAAPARSRPQALTVLLPLLGGVVAALVLAFIYITVAANAEAHHQDRVMNVPEIGTSPDEFLRALHGAAGECISEGNAVDLYQNGDEIFPPMLAAIHASRSSIHFSTLSLIHISE